VQLRIPVGTRGACVTVAAAGGDVVPVASRFARTRAARVRQWCRARAA